MNRVEAVYESGVFRPRQHVDLKDGEVVEITIESVSAKDPALEILDLAMDTGISDLAINIDHYLYGLPKQEDK